MTEHSIRIVDLDALAKDRGSHSSFAPSSSAMWIGCSGSLIPHLLAPDSAGREAAEGTVAHGVGELWLKSGKKPTHLIGTTEWVEEGDWGFLIEIDEVMLEYVQSYVDWCSLLPGDHYVEQRVYFSQITPIPNQGGTADHVACRLHRMIITDLKYGKGVMVYAVDNTQALLYALGFFYEWDWLYDFQVIEIRIAQPRLDHFDTWIVTREELLAFAEFAKKRAYAAWKLDAPRTPSAKACQWCNVKSTCAAVAKLSVDLMAAAFDVIDGEFTIDELSEFKDELTFATEPAFAKVATLSTSDLELLHGYRRMVEAFWKSMEQELYHRAIAGEPLKTLKLVESRSRRAYRNQAKAGRKLIELGCREADVWTREIASPAEAEKLLRKAGHRTKDLPDLLADVVFKPVGKPTLAPISDRRAALVDLSGIAFDDLTETRETEDEEF